MASVLPTPTHLGPFPSLLELPPSPTPFQPVGLKGCLSLQGQALERGSWLPLPCPPPQARGDEWQRAAKSGFSPVLLKVLLSRGRALFLPREEGGSPRAFLCRRGQGGSLLSV